MPDQGTLDLTHGYSLRYQSTELTLFAPNGKMQIRIVFDTEEPVLQIDATSLAVRAKSLNIDCEQFGVHARGDICLQAHGNIRCESANDLFMEAHGLINAEASIQRYHSSQGNFEISSNDDVRIDGERIKLNCPHSWPNRSGAL